MNKEILATSENLLRRLLSRRLFPWPEEKQTTVGEKIAASAQQEAKETITTLNQELTLSPRAVIDKVTPRAESWQFEALLDHIKLKWLILIRLSNF